MTPSATVNMAVAGLEFGSQFVPLYQEHPAVGRVAVCDSRADRLNEVGDQLGIEDRFVSFDDVLSDQRWDAVHIATPVSTHADFAVRALGAGKHCACAVPMATSEGDIARILKAERASGKRYMMMETVVFSRQYLYAKELYDKGELGELTFLRGAHLQDLEGFARYWWGYPPMHYVTHALAPLLDIAGTAATQVSCLGSGSLPIAMQEVYDNPFPLETAHFLLGRQSLAAEVTMSFFATAHPYSEGFSVYGDRRSVEWAQLGNDSQLLYEFLPLEAGRRGRRVEAKVVEAPDRPHLLPKQLAPFTETTEYRPARGGSFLVRNDHGSSHPHLVHDFISSIVEGRPPRVPGWLAANWTLPGIIAHASALARGAVLDVAQHRP